MTPTGRAVQRRGLLDDRPLWDETDYPLRRLAATTALVTYHRRGSGQTTCAGYTTRESAAPPHGSVVLPHSGRIFPPMAAHAYRLIGPDGTPFMSTTKGELGGHRGTKIYGRLDCRAALQAIARGGPYARHRVFFANEADAVSAGYRPCAVCMRTAYDEWKRRARP